ncbi:MAG: polysaccharide biosynthesis C-terminal domain-containing protein, partial [Devosia nanyangense]|nr:polysaccharide biosynthesis C-terminal domain-containing protein [Devosia nanyangense]
MASNILQSLSGTINNIYVGQLIGVEALAAASTFFPIVFFLMSFIIGLSSGSTVLIGQAWGARNIDKVKEVTGTTLTVTFLAGLVVAVLGGFFAPQLMGILGAPANIVDLATSYGRIFLIGMPAFFLFLVVTSVLRGVGDTVTPFVALIISIIVGLVTTPALILGWFGLPKIGVDAAAVASIAGFISVLVFLFFYLRIRKHALAPDRALLKHLRINGELLMLILKLGVPAGV